MTVELKGRAKKCPCNEPPHPGKAVREGCPARSGLSIIKGAEVLGVTRQTLNNLVNRKVGIFPEMAVRLAKAFGGNAEAWLSLQTAFDLVRVHKRARSINVKRYPAGKAETCGDAMKQSKILEPG